MGKSVEMAVLNVAIEAVEAVVAEVDDSERDEGKKSSNSEDMSRYGGGGRACPCPFA